MSYQQRHQTLQKIGLGEYYIRGPLRLVTRPVIIDRVGREDAFVQWIQLPAKALQQSAQLVANCRSSSL